MAKRNLRCFLCLFLYLTVAFGFCGIVSAASGERGSTTYASFGGHTATDGDDTVTGSRLAIGFVKPISELVSYYIEFENAKASGTHTAGSGTKTDIESSTVALSGGVRLSATVSDEPEIAPFVGGGLIVQSYTYDFDYPDSETGSTSGTGYGPQVYFGVTIRPSKRFVLRPAYHFNQVYIESESGKKRTVTSSGLSLALVLVF